MLSMSAISLPCSLLSDLIYAKYRFILSLSMVLIWYLICYYSYSRLSLSSYRYDGMLLVCSDCPGCLMLVFPLLPGFMVGCDCLTYQGNLAAGESMVEFRKVEFGFWKDMDKLLALLLVLAGMFAGLKLPYLVNSYLYYLLMKKSVYLWTVSAKSASISSSLFILAIFRLASFLYFSIFLMYYAQTGCILANFN